VLSRGRAKKTGRYHFNATVGGLGVRPRSSQSWVPLPPVARHLSKVLGHYAPSTVLYAASGVPDCKIHNQPGISVRCSGTTRRARSYTPQAVSLTAKSIIGQTSQ
jgi:hypothetical protein